MFASVGLHLALPSLKLVLLERSLPILSASAGSQLFLIRSLELGGGSTLQQIWVEVLLCKLADEPVCDSFCFVSVTLKLRLRNVISAPY